MISFSRLQGTIAVFNKGKMMYSTKEVDEVYQLSEGLIFIQEKDKVTLVDNQQVSMKENIIRAGHNETHLYLEVKIDRHTFLEIREVSTGTHLCSLLQDEEEVDVFYLLKWWQYLFPFNFFVVEAFTPNTLYGFSEKGQPRSYDIGTGKYSNKSPKKDEQINILDLESEEITWLI